jgi:hypothetical protein
LSLSHDTETPEVDPVPSPSRETKTILERIHDAEQRKAIPLADRLRVIQEKAPEDAPKTSSSGETESTEDLPARSRNHEAKSLEVEPELETSYEVETSADVPTPSEPSSEHEAETPEIALVDRETKTKKKKHLEPWESHKDLEDTCGAPWQLPASERDKKRNQSRRQRRQTTQERPAREAKEEQVPKKRQEEKEDRKRRRKASKKPAMIPPSFVSSMGEFDEFGFSHVG